MGNIYTCFFWRKSKLLSPTMMKVDPWMDRSTTEERRKSNSESNWGHGHGGCRSSDARSRHHSLVVAAASLIDKACTLRRRPCLYCRKLRGTERSPSHGTRDMDLAPTAVRIGVQRTSTVVPGASTNHQCVRFFFWLIIAALLKMTSSM